jgi:hypothetical protein
MVTPISELASKLIQRVPPMPAALDVLRELEVL